MDISNCATLMRNSNKIAHLLDVGSLEDDVFRDIARSIFLLTTVKPAHPIRVVSFGLQGAKGG